MGMATGNNFAINLLTTLSHMYNGIRWSESGCVMCPPFILLCTHHESASAFTQCVHKAISLTVMNVHWKESTKQQVLVLQSR